MEESVRLKPNTPRTSCLSIPMWQPSFLSGSGSRRERDSSFRALSPGTAMMRLQYSRIGSGAPAGVLYHARNVVLSQASPVMSNTGGGVKKQHPRARFSPRISDQEWARKCRLAHIPTRVSNLPRRVEGSARDPKGSHAPGGYFDNIEVWAVLDGEPANSEQDGGPGDSDPAFDEVNTGRKHESGASAPDFRWDRIFGIVP